MSGASSANTRLRYPLTMDYEDAVLAPEIHFLDETLKKCRPVMQKDPLDPIAMPVLWAGGFARVFKMQSNEGKHFAFRCWICNIGDGANIYQAINNHLAKLNSRYFVHFKYLNEAIMVKGAPYPGLTMEWIDEPDLENFIKVNINNSSLLENASKAFMQMTDFLHSHEIAHGDFQAENMKVSTAALSKNQQSIQNGGRVDIFESVPVANRIANPQGEVGIILIDYDTMYVPALSGRPALNKGLDSYQHPRRAESKQITPKDDYFSELVIYLSLRALAKSQDIRDYWGMRNKTRDKELIFIGADFARPYESLLIYKLAFSGDSELESLTAALLRACEQDSILNLKPLSEIVGSLETFKLSSDDVKKLRLQQKVAINPDEQTNGNTRNETEQREGSLDSGKTSVRLQHLTIGQRVLIAIVIGLLIFLILYLLTDNINN